MHAARRPLITAWLCPRPLWNPWRDSCGSASLPGDAIDHLTTHVPTW